MEGLFSLLPLELQRAVVGQLASRWLCHVACVCRAAAVIADDIARKRCASLGIQNKGEWCTGSSWRVQSVGRRFYAHSRVRPRQHVTAAMSSSYATRRSAQQQRLFEQPAQLIALEGFEIGQTTGSEAQTDSSRPSHITVAVCDAARRCVAVVAVRCRPDESRLVCSIAVDGIPCGICEVPSEAGEFHAAVSLQGVDESGNAIAGVQNTTHRIILIDLVRGQVLSSTWSNDGSRLLSYPNGISVLPPIVKDTLPQMHQHDLVLACTDWNHQRIVCFAPNDFQENLLAQILGPARPADCTSFATRRGGHALAVADYEGEFL